MRQKHTRRRCSLGDNSRQEIVKPITQQVWEARIQPRDAASIANGLWGCSGVGDSVNVQEVADKRLLSGNDSLGRRGLSGVTRGTTARR